MSLLQLDSKTDRLGEFLLVSLAAILFVAFNGGIGIGLSNHAGLLPVVRRILDPSYLPGDFNIMLRLYHHRSFANLLAGLAFVFGEERGIIILHSIGALLFSYSLWRLCRAMHLSPAAFAIAALFLLSNLLWMGRGLEENTILGNMEIQPPLFAHAFLLLMAAFLIHSHYRAAAVAAGMTLFFHLQIGVIATLMAAPIFAMKLRSFGVKETLRLSVCCLIPASPAFLNLLFLLQRGILRPREQSVSLAEYIDFRHPHHFELMSAAHASWIGAHLLFLVFAWLGLRKWKREEARAAAVPAALAAMLTLLSLVHFTDYYLVQQDKIANIQMIRLSPVISVFGVLDLLLVVRFVTARLSIRFEKQWIPSLASVLLFAIGIGFAFQTSKREEPELRFGLQRYADRPANWVLICNWIRDNGPRDSTYLTPPGQDGFTALSNRSNIVEFKINPDGASFMAEWFDRLRDLSGGRLPHERGLKNRKPLNKAYADLNREQLISLGQKYGARYAVLPKDSKVEFEVLHQNEAYRLVILPE
jgi:hypothetical protein